jgi:hypothetical protein
MTTYYIPVKIKWNEVPELGRLNTMIFFSTLQEAEKAKEYLEKKYNTKLEIRDNLPVAFTEVDDEQKK